ncbi:MAG: hypothetical protein ACKV2O_12010 [Acidimicrobiales bacterium]
MARSVEEARQELDQEFRQFQEGLGRIHVALGELARAGATDDVYQLLERLEDVVHDVRTGGVMGSGAKGHREAREKWLSAGGA